MVGEPKGILKFLDYHLCLQGQRMVTALSSSLPLMQPPTVELTRTSDARVLWELQLCQPILRERHVIIDAPQLRHLVIQLIVLVSDRWFNSPVLVMKRTSSVNSCSLCTRSPPWRPRAIYQALESTCRLDSCLGGAGVVPVVFTERIELLGFTKQLPDGAGLSFEWWYGTLWFHFEKLDPTVGGEVESIARGMCRVAVSRI